MLIQLLPDIHVMTGYDVIVDGAGLRVRYELYD